VSEILEAHNNIHTQNNTVKKMQTMSAPSGALAAFKGPTSNGRDGE